MTTPDSQADDLAKVHYLPELRQDSAPAPMDTEVIEGELISDADYAVIQKVKAIERYRGRRQNAVTVARVTKTAFAGERSKALVWSHVGYTLGGAGIVARRAWESRTNSRYDRIMNQLEVAKDFDRLDLWECKAEKARQSRHQRHMDWLDAPKKLAIAAGISIGTVTALLLVLGFVIAVASKDAGMILAPITAVMNAIKWTYWLVTAYFVLIVGGVTAFALYCLWRVGKNAEKAPEWSKPTAPTTKGEVVNITAPIVVAALRDLGIRKLRDAIKGDPESGERMLGLIGKYGPGWQVDVTLPPEVTVSQIMKVRETLAGNLDRKVHEVHIECSPDSERVFTLWVADSGALDQRVPPSPLLAEDFGPVDIYRDLMPWGEGLKGDPIELNLLQQHFLLSGLSKQGKTAAARALVLWIALDPSTRILLSDLKGFGDWSMFEGLAEILIEGAGAENFIATCDMLEDAVAEMQRRYERWRAMGRKGDIGRADSQPGSGFEPLFVVVDEVQKLYGCTTEHPDGGEVGGNGKKSRAARAAQALHDQARAVNIHLLQFSQNPNDRNLPVLVREGAMIRASLFVGTESIAKMALGEAPVDTGAAPHALRSGLDRGTVVLAPGESMDLPGGATHTTVRTHYISTEDAYTVAERAKGLRTQRATAQKRDLLADVLEVCGKEDAPRAADVVVRLRKLAAGYKPYEITGETLVELLETKHKVRRGSKGGIQLVRTNRVQAALNERDVKDD